MPLNALSSVVCPSLRHFSTLSHKRNDIRKKSVLSSSTTSVRKISHSKDEERGCTGCWWGNRREGAHWGDLGVDGWIILGWISRRWDVGIWTGLCWPRIETGGGRL